MRLRRIRSLSSSLWGFPGKVSHRVLHTCRAERTGAGRSFHDAVSLPSASPSTIRSSTNRALRNGSCPQCICTLPSTVLSVVARWLGLPFLTYPAWSLREYSASRYMNSTISQIFRDENRGFRTAANGLSLLACSPHHSHVTNQAFILNVLFFLTGNLLNFLRG